MLTSAVLLALHDANACVCSGVLGGEVFPPSGDVVPTNARFWAFPVGPGAGESAVRLQVDEEPWPFRVVEHRTGELVWTEVVPDGELPPGSDVALILATVEVARWVAGDSADTEPPSWNGRLRWKLRDFPEGWSCGEHVQLWLTAVGAADDSPTLLVAEPVEDVHPELVGPNGEAFVEFSDSCGGDDPSLLEDGGVREYAVRVIDIAGNSSRVTVSAPDGGSRSCGCSSQPPGAGFPLLTLAVALTATRSFRSRR